MGRNFSQMIKQELDNLDKDPETRTSAIKALKSCIKDMDSSSIPIFLTQLSETNEFEHAITLYEDIARVHGSAIVPHINNIMLTIIKTLSSSSSSNPDPFDLHHAWPKVVSTIARYGMDPTTPDYKKQDIMHSLCKPLSDSLLARQESLSSGAALCLKGLVELDDWRFCSGQMVNEVCQRVAAGLENLVQGDSHMGLVTALAKRNGLVVEGYARLLVRAGVRILNTGVTEEDSWKRLSAIRMVNGLITSLDYKSVMSELTFVIEEVQKFQNDQIADVKEAACEAIQTAKRILWSNVNVSLKDGLFSGHMSTPSSAVETEAQEDHDDGFTGFVYRSPINGDPRSPTHSPQRSRSYVNADNINRFTSPRKPSKSRHVSDDGCPKTQSRRFRSPPSSKLNRRSNANYDQNIFNDSFTYKGVQFNATSAVVSSTEDILTNTSDNLQQCQKPVPESHVKSRILSTGLFVLFVAVVCYLWLRDINNEGYNLVPT
ncbi:putative armadillo-like helical protein [Helianthus annuus]|nr:putative armadillo-like helical protein [Helianthus annuus]